MQEAFSCCCPSQQMTHKQLLRVHAPQAMHQCRAADEAARVAPIEEVRLWGEHQVAVLPEVSATRVPCLIVDWFGEPVVMREDTSHIYLHQKCTLLVGSEVPIDVPPPLAACGPPHGATHVVIYLFSRSGHIVRALTRHT